MIKNNLCAYQLFYKYYRATGNKFQDVFYRLSKRPTTTTYDGCLAELGWAGQVLDDLQRVHEFVGAAVIKKLLPLDLLRIRLSINMSIIHYEPIIY